MSMHLVTGYAGQEHVTASDAGSFNLAMMGNGQFVLDRGNKFSASIISNTKVRIMDGDILMQGRHLRQVENTYTEVVFDNGTQGLKRNDLVVIRYEKDSTTGIESASFKVIKGTSVDSNPVDPEYIEGDITELTGDLVNEMPLYRVSFDGLTIQTPVRLFETLDTWKNLQDDTVEAVTIACEALLDEMEDRMNQTLGQLVKVKISTDETLVGETIIATDGTTQVSATVPDTQEVILALPNLGTWTFTNPVTQGTQTLELQYFGEYSMNMASWKVLGLQIDLSNSNPDTSVTYTDDAVGMTQQEIQDWLGYKPCLFVNGAVDGYLNPDNYAQYEDGTSADITTLGNDVMIEFPKRGYSISTSQNIITIKMTDEPDKAGFCYKPFSRASEGDRDAFYYGAFKGYCSGSKMYSSSGKQPTASQTRATYRGYATARGTGYAQNGFYQLTYIQICYLMQFKNLNSQTTVGYGYVLSTHGDGSVNRSVNTGGANAYGMNCEVIKSTNPSYMTDQNHQVKCLGIEDFWGNIWQWVDGFTTDANRNMFTCFIPSLFSDSTSAEGQTNQGQGATANIGNYMSKPQGGTDTGFVAKEVSGSETTYFCDSAYLYASCVMFFGGSWSDGAYAGAFPLFVTSASSASFASVASRLMYV